LIYLFQEINVQSTQITSFVRYL